MTTIDDRYIAQMFGVSGPGDQFVSSGPGGMSSIEAQRKAARKPSAAASFDHIPEHPDTQAGTAFTPAETIGDLFSSAAEGAMQDAGIGVRAMRTALGCFFVDDAGNIVGPAPEDACPPAPRAPSGGGAPAPAPSPSGPVFSPAPAKAASSNTLILAALGLVAGLFLLKR